MTHLASFTMHKMTTIASVLGMIAGLALPCGASGPLPGDLWVTFGSPSSNLCGTPPAFVTNNKLYVVTADVELAGYEFSLTISDPSVIVFAAIDVTNPSGSVNVGTPPLEWIVGVGLCAGGPGFVPLVEVTFGYFVASISDVLICLRPSDPASLNPPSPAYLDCSGNILPFSTPEHQTPYPLGCSVLWPTFQCPVSTEADTWGAVKSQYRAR